MPRLNTLLDDRHGESREGAHVAGAVPGVAFAGRMSDGLVAFKEAGHEELAGERGEADAADLAVGDRSFIPREA